MMSCLKVPGGKAIPLRGVAVEGDVFGGHAHMRVRQRYQNDESKPVEAVYTFPLPSDGTLVGFSMTCAGRKIEGAVKEREEAFRSYDDAVHDGHGAALLDEERPNVFTASVGNLLPGEETVIEVCYVQKLAADEGALRIMIPTLVAPRYIPGTAAGSRTGDGWAEPTDRVPDADRITPRIGEVDYGLTLALTFDIGQQIELDSPSHAIQVTREGGKVRASLRDSAVALDRDLVVIARGLERGPMKTVALHRDGDEGFVALTVIPDLGEANPRPLDVVFLVDTSGSMEGDSMEQARAALLLCLRHLREGDRFNAIRFSSGHKALFRDLRPFNQKTLEEADPWARGLRADGGTELMAPLIEAIGQARDGVVVLLTDGQVGNEAEILGAALEARKSARIYTFGIGTNVSDTLLRDLAKRTSGAAEFIHPGERIDEKVVAQFARATAKRVSDVKVTWKGIEAREVAPAEAAAMVDNEPWTMYARLRGRGVGEAEIRGTLDGKPFYLSAPIDLDGAGKEPLLAKLWAAERVRDLEMEGLSGRRAERMKERIVELGVSYGIATRFTSFVAIETRTGDRRASGYPETRFVPVNAPAGWGMMRRRQAATLGMAMFGAAPPPMVMARPGPAKRFTGAPMLSMDDMTAAAPPKRGHVTVAPVDPITDIFFRQQASGLWGSPSDTNDRIAADTAAALRDLWQAGVTTAHPVHGALVKKAIDAALELARKLAADPAELLRALAWLLSAGRRERAAIAAELPGRPDETQLTARVHALFAVVHPH